MAEIATYVCTNLLCRYTVRLSRDFPVWHAHTPIHLRKLRISTEARPYIARYRSEAFCSPCKKTLDADDKACTTCASQTLLEMLSQMCPQCKKAEFVMPQLSIY
jgi:hypothetical protein